MKQIKYIVLCIALAIGFVNCSNSKSTKKETETNVEVINYNDSVVITPSHNEDRELKDGFAYGFVENVSADYGKAENTMIGDFNKYMESLMNANMQENKKYINTDLFLYFKRMAIQEGEVLNLDDFVNHLGTGLRSVSEKLQKSGLKVSYTLANLERRINYENNILIVFSNTTNLIDKDNNKIHFIPFEQTVGISKDKGQTWTFVGIDVSFPTIFDKVYPQEVIDAVMNY